MLAGLGIVLMWTMEQNFASAGGYGEGWPLAIIYTQWRVNVLSVMTRVRNKQQIYIY